VSSTRRSKAVLGSVALAAVMAAACGDDEPTVPSSGAIVTLAVAGETFYVALTTPAQVTAARAAQAGGPARIPIGRIVSGRQVNAGWTWHLEDVAFVEVAIELCDGRPSDVEREGAAFGGGQFCPWAATVLRIDEG
jgi:hypothetical protein